MSLLQGVSQFLPSPMLHTKSHQVKTKEKIVEIQKTKGRWFAQCGNQRPSLCALGQQNHARHGLRRHFQLRGALSF